MRKLLLTVVFGLCVVAAFGRTGDFNFFEPAPAPVVSPIVGVSPVCMGSSFAFSDATPGGVWSSSNSAVATVDAFGTVFGVATGTVTISYSVTDGTGTSTVSYPVTVNPATAVISGAGSVCSGSFVILTDAAGTGTWTSSNAAIASAGSTTGIISGISAGTVTITFTKTPGCYRSTIFTVNATPAAISGSSMVCVGSTTALSNTLGGGTWTSSNTLTATIGITSGIVTGAASGYTVIRYTMSTGCAAQMNMTINPVPGVISGTKSVCIGAMTSLSDISPSGAWSSSNTAVATVATGSGFVAGISAGTTNITYTLSATGCYRTAIVTVNALPPAISGTARVCVGSTTLLTDAITGGTWSSSNTGMATVATSGMVTGVAVGIPLISYKLPTGCVITIPVTVNPLPSTIIGSAKVCIGSTITLTDTSAGGTWSTGSGLISVSGSGNVSGISAGTGIVTYTIGTGCITTRIVTINALPPAISGTTVLCAGATTTLTNAVTGGTWSSSDVSLAVISGTGFLAAVAAGNPVISYQQAGTGCTRTATFTINPVPAAITGTASMCAGAGTALTNASPGGNWSSGAVAIAIVDASGNVFGSSPGTAIISYSFTTGCRATRIVTVNQLPAVISGFARICTGATTTFSDTPTGGTWSSSDLSISTITGAGVASGLAAGTTNITYTLGTGCAAVRVLTVNALPPAITGTMSVCVGLSTPLTNAAAGGTWSSSNTSIATVNISGGVFGMAAGTATISYVLPTGCKTTTTMVVNAAPPAISGTSAVCMGASATLSNATGGGTWSSGNPAVADITGTGTIIPVSAGTTIITYTAATTCIRTKIIAINPLPEAITGTGYLCTGATTVLSDVSAGGTWAATPAVVATIGSATGIVNGIGLGTAMVTYTLGTGCATTTIVTVSIAPHPITGIYGICEGSYLTLLESTPGGTWSVANPSIATIGAGTGTVNGILAGTTTVSYTLSSGCYSTATITINAAPALISGTRVVCSGSSITLSNAVTGGVWTSSPTSVAVVGSVTGLVTGGAAGTANITYTVGGSCRTVLNITVNPLPNAITGTLRVCAGLMTALSDPFPGGAWSTDASGNASIDGAGFVTGITAGTAVITYMLPTGCLRTTTVTVNPLPAPISGPGEVCLGRVITLTDPSPGGTWGTSNMAVATIGLTVGTLTGVGAGTSIITYRIPTGCIITRVITVNPLPSPITGLTSVCVGATTVLSEAAGGTWSSSNPAIASIAGSGVVTGVSAGNATITYTLGTGCIKTVLFTVYALPAAISGASAVCIGGTISVSDATLSGAWSSDNTVVATVTSGGTVSGHSAGSAHIIYTLGSGCTASKTVIVNPNPPAITGTAFMCAGLGTTLSDAATGGTWTSSYPATATIGSASGVVSGVAAGTTVITYTLPTTCKITTVVTVNPLPAAIAGNLNVCQGYISALSNAATGGTWSSSNPSVGTIGITSGVAYGVAVGTATITYTRATGCLRTTTITVNTSPAVVTGPGNVCSGLTISLTDATAGGSWTSGNLSVAHVGGTTGIVTGVAAGTAEITYSIGACRATKVVTVATSPAAIYGTRTVCAGSITSLTDPVASGTWSSSNTSVAFVALTSGNVTGVSAGTATITYTVGTSCFKTAVVTVNPSPAPISGATTICVGSITALSDAVPGGTWSTSNYVVAPVTSAGVVTGASYGTARITYSMGAGCRTSVTIVVNSVPVPITGASNVCIGSYTTLSNGTLGGTWTSSDSTIASIGLVSGGVLGVAPGSATITYTISSGCLRTTSITVNPLPAAISGTGFVVCSGSSLTLSDDVSGGHWSSSNTAVATAGSSTGIVTGVSGGTATITYKLSPGCVATATVTVNQSPAAITGPSTVCVDASIFLSDVTSGGTWQASNGFATIDGFGNVTGVSPGIDTFSYVVASGCMARYVVSVNSTPADVTGSGHICTGDTISLHDGSAGGHWTSSNTSIATVGSASGIVFGETPGTVTITYSLSAICHALAVVTVTQTPAPIVGTTYFCVPNSMNFSDSIAGGTWTSSDPGVAYASPVTGHITAVSGGTAVITYTLPGGCIATASVTISPMAVVSSIGGYNAVCLGSSITLTDAEPGGVWSSSNPAVAIVNPVTGLVTAISEGNDTITYMVTRFCSTAMATLPLTVGPRVILDNITGNNTVCPLATDTLMNTTPGGLWTITNPAKGSISTDGIFTGLAPGLDTVVYTVFGTCAAVVRATVIINELPAHPNIVAHPGGELCTNTQFMNIGAGIGQPNGFLFTWNAVNAQIYGISPNKQNILVNFPSAGTATISVTSKFLLTGCAITDSFVANIAGSSAPGVAGVTYSAPDFTCTDGSADSYQWGYDNGYTFDSTLIPGATAQTLSLASPDFANNFYWVMTVHGGCIQKSYYRLPPAVGVGHTSIGDLSFTLFPNPADAKVYIEVKGLTRADGLSVKLFDMLGKDMQGCLLVDGKGSIDVSGLAPGVYSVMFIKDGMKIGARTFVKN